MARGWESKAVEEQIEESARISEASSDLKTPEAPVSIERQLKHQGLILLRSQLKDQLSRARSVAHRQMLHQSLREIEQQLKQFDS